MIILIAKNKKKMKKEAGKKQDFCLIYFLL